MVERRWAVEMQGRGEDLVSAGLEVDFRKFSWLYGVR